MNHFTKAPYHYYVKRFLRTGNPFGPVYRFPRARARYRAVVHRLTGR